jgi:hypothetical protein
MMRYLTQHAISRDFFLRLDDPDLQREFLLLHLSRSYDRPIKKILNIAERELGLKLDSRERMSIARRLRTRLGILEYDGKVERRETLWRLR